MGFTGKPHDLHVAGSAISAYLTEINSLVKNIVRFVALQLNIETHTIIMPTPVNTTFTMGDHWSLLWGDLKRAGEVEAYVEVFVL